ncbi:ribulose phosphate epimerase [Mycobacterium sp. IS-1496]|uniref:ribulose phosphate epimerase n=1 Tax=Mycobacterium sp. IS-1496 TaxID=1772284 RepID=UPI00074180F4|nr:ribulose phosphate epimerase [Mycobacterium sp. IS-1496]KUI27505.1 ribulose phosphate epimerase [Mycobacterium sp. IS-1496]
MTAAAPLAPWHRDYPGLLAGSVYAVPPPARTAAARAMHEAGLGVHVDLMAENEGLPAGVALTELADIADTVGPSGFDVHLIGSPEFVDARLAHVLTCQPAKVFLPWAAFTEERAAAVRDAGASAWVALWQEWDGLGTDPHWPAAPDGVLVMLIEPGTRGRCRVERLGIVTALATDRAEELPVIVDGGVTEDVAPLCVTAGAEAMVVGRALLAGPADREE